MQVASSEEPSRASHVLTLERDVLPSPAALIFLRWIEVMSRDDVMTVEQGSQQRDKVKGPAGEG